MRKIYSLIFIIFIAYIAHAQKPVADFAADKYRLCQNDCINFTDSSTNSPLSWQWTFSGATPSISSDQNPQTVCYGNAGTFDVKLVVSNSFGSDSITKSIVVFQLLPTPVITDLGGIGIIGLCPADSAGGDTLCCSTDPGYASYQWYENANLIPGATNPCIVVRHIANYNVQVTDTNGCSIYVGTNIIIWEYPPVASFVAPKTTICQWDCIDFYNRSSGGTEYIWLFPGAVPDSSSLQCPTNICYENPGSYDVKLIAGNDYGSDSTTLTITVNPSPPIPEIHGGVGTIYCSSDPSYVSYQWYIDGSLILGATDTILYSVNCFLHHYHVLITNIFGCSIATGRMCEGVEQLSNNAIITLFPNPVQDQFTIQYGGDSQFTMEIIDMLGQKTSFPPPFLSVPVNHLSYSSYVVDVNTLLPGVYLLKMQSAEGNSMVKKFIKQ